MMLPGPDAFELSPTNAMQLMNATTHPLKAISQTRFLRHHGLSLDARPPELTRACPHSTQNRAFGWFRLVHSVQTQLGEVYIGRKCISVAVASSGLAESTLVSQMDQLSHGVLDIARPPAVIEVSSSERRWLAWEHIREIACFSAAMIPLRRVQALIRGD